ncbi:hypothetical protein OZ411_39805 [Bradyrhizobium sp. Arg237L]|uniref:hypothetical protein n=1 Tax=Bradyrhizobium sp. Arg237L TaxID=3003352 RepID=UPI00249F5507|nr:hypothetical protein [Bradyrhizobium sp. Arg237L]MDI4238941.1 hypothetical protein [Bradyrhizobium sp. Arg237L]
MIKAMRGLRRYSYGAENLPDVARHLGQSASVLPRRKHMPQETRETRRNYIGILYEETDEPRMVGELRTANDRQMRRYLQRLVAAVFNRRIEAR